MSRATPPQRCRRILAAGLLALGALAVVVPSRPAPATAPAVAGLGTVSGYVSPVAVTADPPGDGELAAFLSATHADVTAVWTRKLAAQGLGPPTTRLVLFGAADTPVLNTACGAVPAEVAPFFCGGDATIYLGRELVRLVWSQVGDMAVVTVLAHELGHAVQQQLGIRPAAGSPAFELQADCLSGAYAQDAGARGLLHPGDTDEARRLSRLVGDDGPSADPHGTSDQREQAWVQGYSGGSVACVGF